MAVKQDILHEHMQNCGAQYTIQRLMEDIGGLIVI